ncbi:MAG: hypothetical protein JJ863_24705 [Deltaproteobacteria bacterium]|nr:hypothetical protein [Deltaproteobacteria bacterium]
MRTLPAIAAVLLTVVAVAVVSVVLALRRAGAFTKTEHRPTRVARAVAWLLLFVGFAWWLLHVWGYGAVVMQFEPRERTLILSWSVSDLVQELALFVGPGLLAHVGVRAWQKRRAKSRE